MRQPKRYADLVDLTGADAAACCEHLRYHLIARRPIAVLTGDTELVSTEDVDKFLRAYPKSVAPDCTGLRYEHLHAGSARRRTRLRTDLYRSESPARRRDRQKCSCIYRLLPLCMHISLP